MYLVFPYKSTPFATTYVIDTNTLLNYPLAILYGYSYSQYDIRFYDKNSDFPDFSITQQEYEKIIKQKEYRKEFQELIDE